MITSGNISDIKHCAINDGPGIRVTVFLKGCPLACAWCHNPESISPQREIMFIANRCIHCGECIHICPYEALRFEGRKILCDRSKCTLCGECTDNCPTLALEMVGEEISPDNLIEIIEKDRAIELRPWHNVAQKKYEQLGREYRNAACFAEPKPRDLSAAVLLFAKHGIQAQVQ